MPQPSRRSKDSDVTSPQDEEGGRPLRDNRGPPISRGGDDRYRHNSSHRPYDNRKSGGYYDDYARGGGGGGGSSSGSGYKDYEYEDGHSRDSWERDRHYDDKHMRDREPRDRDNRHGDNRDSRDIRDRDAVRDKKDYDTHIKVHMPRTQFSNI